MEHLLKSKLRAKTAIVTQNHITASWATKPEAEIALKNLKKLYAGRLKLSLIRGGGGDWVVAGNPGQTEAWDGGALDALTEVWSEESRKAAQQQRGKHQQRTKRHAAWNQRRRQQHQQAQQQRRPVRRATGAVSGGAGKRATGSTAIRSEWIGEGIDTEAFAKDLAHRLLKTSKGRFPSDKLLWLSGVIAAFVKKNEPLLKKQSKEGSLDSERLMKALKRFAMNAAGHYDAKSQQEHDEMLAGLEYLDEVSPPGWEGSVKAMKKHKDIDNPWALAWSMKNKGAKAHYKATKKGEPEKKAEYADEDEVGPSEDEQPWREGFLGEEGPSERSYDSARTEHHLAKQRLKAAQRKGDEDRIKKAQAAVDKWSGEVAKYKKSAQGARRARRSGKDMAPQDRQAERLRQIRARRGKSEKSENKGCPGGEKMVFGKCPGGSTAKAKS